MSTNPKALQLMELMEELEIVPKIQAELFQDWISAGSPEEWLQIKANLSVLDKLEEVVARLGAE